MREKLQIFNEARDEAVRDLEPCDKLLTDSEIRRLGYALVSSASAEEGSDEHELHVYSQGDRRMVFLQTYSEVEGGLYFQSLFAGKETVDELEKEIVRKSVESPSVFLAETILHYAGVNIPGTGRLFSYNSIYSGCHHFLKIAHDPALAKLALENFKNRVAIKKDRDDWQFADRIALVLKAL
jgi:hypothetical protein